MFSQRLRGLADFPLAGQEDQDVAGTEARQLVGRIDNGVVKVALVVLFLQIGDRPVAHLDRVKPAGYLDYRCRLFTDGEMLRKALGINGR